MATTYRYLAVDGEDQAVRQWFLDLEPPPNVVDFQNGATLKFGPVGNLGYDSAGRVDPKRSPLVSHFPARRTRGILWTVGEVHFLPVGLRSAFPELDRVRADFQRWIGRFERVFDSRFQAEEWAYFLEGSTLNADSPIVAMPEAMIALRRGTYFVDMDDSEVALDRLCRQLALRDVTCEPSVG